MIPTKQNVGVGKGPCFSHADGEGKREGMSCDNGINNPIGHSSDEKARELQRKLYASAKRNQKRRFHALYDRIYRSDILEEAWNRVRRRRGSAGVDGETLAEIEEYGVDRMLNELRLTLKEGEYRPSAVLRCYIPKGDGKERPLGIPTIRDRVVQMAAKLVLEPIFEADFRDCSRGFRPKRRAVDAMEKIRVLANKGYNHVLDADIENYFGSIDHDLLLSRVSLRISDRRVLKLLRGWLKAGVMDEGRHEATITGTPQGGVISPLLSNIYLHVLDAVWERRCAGLGVLIRYADDFVIMCKSARSALEAERRVRILFDWMKLSLHPKKTKIVDLSYGRDGFEFLGWMLRKRLSGRITERGSKLYFLHRWPSQKSMRRIHEKVRNLIGPKHNGVKDIRVLIKGLNPVLRGWGNYFRTGNSSVKFSKVDAHVWKRLFRFLKRRYGRNLKPGQVLTWSRDWFRQMGLYLLQGTIRYPGAVHAFA